MADPAYRDIREHQIPVVKAQGSSQDHQRF